MVRTLFVQWVGGHISLVHVDNAVNVEGDLLAVRIPVLVAKAVSELAILPRRKGVVAGCDGLFVELVLIRRVDDLPEKCLLIDMPKNPTGLQQTCSSPQGCSFVFTFSRKGTGGVCSDMIHTQKSISRLPADPNSLSPTWKVTVMVSSLWSCS